MVGWTGRRLVGRHSPCADDRVQSALLKENLIYTDHESISQLCNEG